MGTTLEGSLGGVVERLRRTRSVKWLPGHDQAAAARAPVSEPLEVKKDIEDLED